MATPEASIRRGRASTQDENDDVDDQGKSTVLEECVDPDYEPNQEGTSRGLNKKLNSIQSC